MADLTNKEKGSTPKTYPVETDFEAIRNVAKSMVDWELEVTKGDGTLKDVNFVHHPFFDNEVVMWKNHEGEKEIYYILEDPEALAVSRERMKERLDAATSIDKILLSVKKGYLFDFLHLIEHHMSRNDFVQILRGIWTRVESVNDEGNPYSIQNLVDIMQNCDAKTLMEEDDYNFYQKLPEELTIYRGFVMYSKDYIYHMSWTLDVNVAKLFVGRLSQWAEQKCVAYEAKIKKKDVLAYFSDRDESTVVVDPNALYDVKEITDIL